MEKIQPIPYRLPDGSGAFKVDCTLWIGDVKHRVRKRGFSTSRAACQWADRELARVRLGMAPEARRRAPVTSGDDPRTWTVAAVFGRLVEYWRSTGRKRETTLASEQAAFTRSLLPLIGGRALISLTQRDALHVLQLDQGYALPRNCMILRGIVRDASKVGAVAPDIDVQVPRKVDNGRLVFLEPSEIAAIRDELPEAWKAAFLFAVATGVRVGELVGAQWADIDQVNRSLTVRHALVRGGNRHYWHPPKNGKPRTIPLSPLALQALEEQAALVPPVAKPASLDAGRIFPQSVVAFQAAIKRAATRAGVEKNVHPHILRHTFASLQVQGGVPLERVSTMLGHSSLTMTMKYAHLRPSQLQESVDQLSALVSAAL